MHQLAVSCQGKWHLKDQWKSNLWKPKWNCHFKDLLSHIKQIDIAIQLTHSDTGCCAVLKTHGWKATILKHPPTKTGIRQAISLALNGGPRPADKKNWLQILAEKQQGGGQTYLRGDDIPKGGSYHREGPFAKSHQMYSHNMPSFSALVGQVDAIGEKCAIKICTFQVNLKKCVSQQKQTWFPNWIQMSLSVALSVTVCLVERWNSHSPNSSVLNFLMWIMPSVRLWYLIHISSSIFLYTR